MLGSLSEFLNINDRQYTDQTSKIYLISQPNEEQRDSRNSVSLQNNKRLPYQPIDKSSIMRAKKRHQGKQLSAIQLATLFHNEELQYTKKRHWSQKKNEINQQSLKHKHKLLNAIVKTQENQARYNPKSLYQRSMDRILIGFTKIKNRPKMNRQFVKSKAINQQILLQPEHKTHASATTSFSQSPKRIIEIQKSIKWAKIHKKNFKCFYQQRGKSIQLLEQQKKQGKSNFQLQKQQQKKKNILQRSVECKDFLHKMQTQLQKEKQIQRSNSGIRKSNKNSNKLPNLRMSFKNSKKNTKIQNTDKLKQIL